MIPVQSSLKKDEKTVFNNLQNSRKKREPQFQLGLPVRTAEIRKEFSEGVSTKYSNKLYKISERLDKILSYRIKFLHER